VKLIKSLSNEDGNILLEAVAFTTLAFGLILSLGIDLVQLERRQIGLEQLARNATRYFLLNPDSDFSEALSTFQELDSQLQDDRLTFAVRCQPTDCDSSGTFVSLEITSGNNVAKAFGVIP
jgi:hypothetical protein